MKKLGFDMLIILFISALLGYITSDFLHIVKGILLYTLLITTGTYLYVSNTNKKNIEKIASIDEVIDEFIELQTIKVACPCQQTTHDVFIRPNDENIITCDYCNNVYKLEMQFTPVLTTTPLNVEDVYTKLLKERVYSFKDE